MLSAYIVLCCLLVLFFIANIGLDLYNIARKKQGRLKHLYTQLPRWERQEHSVGEPWLALIVLHIRGGGAHHGGRWHGQLPHRSGEDLGIAQQTQAGRVESPSLHALRWIGHHSYTRYNAMQEDPNREWLHPGLQGPLLPDFWCGFLHGLLWEIFHPANRLWLDP